MDMHEALVATYDKLVLDGWCWGKTTDSDGSSCLYWTMNLVVKDRGGRFEDLEALVKAVTTTMNPRYHPLVAHIVDFNDKDGRTLDEVLDLLRKTIDRFEDSPCPTPAPSPSSCPSTSTPS